MKTYKQLQKEQEQLNKELLECPKCGVTCEWGEIIEGTECGACFYKEKEQRPKECEKCGGELGVLLVGDESYDYCKNCKWVTH